MLGNGARKRSNARPEVDRRVGGRGPQLPLGLLLVASALAVGCTSSTVPGLRRVLLPGMIPAVESPEWVGATRAERFLEENEPVVGLDIAGGATRAYSLWMLDRREIVDDELPSGPIAVTWCPLAGSSVVYDRRVDGRALTFRVSGQLYRGALVLQDRETGTLWSQVDGRAIQGPLAGRRLAALPATRTTWNEWRRRHPDTRVLAKEWFDRRGHSDYSTYAADPTRIGLFDDGSDPRLPAKELVWGVARSQDAVAVRLDSLEKSGPTELVVGGEPLLVVPEPGGLGARAFHPRLAARRLHFEPSSNGTLRDRETGSRWSLPELQAVAGPLCGAELEAEPGQSIYWFAWSRFHPRSRIEPMPVAPAATTAVAALGAAHRAGPSCARPSTSTLAATLATDR